LSVSDKSDSLNERAARDQRINEITYSTGAAKCPLINYATGS